MAKFKYIVTIECDSPEQAAEVVANRLGIDDDYGFDYSIDYKEVRAPSTLESSGL